MVTETDDAVAVVGGTGCRHRPGVDPEGLDGDGSRGTGDPRVVDDRSNGTVTETPCDSPTGATGHD